MRKFLAGVCLLVAVTLGSATVWLVDEPEESQKVAHGPFAEPGGLA